MKDNKKAMLWALLLVALIVWAILLYGGMSKRYDGDTLAESEAGDTQLAPNFTVYDGEGNPVKLSDYRGKPVVINFWATWCYYCKEEMPDFDEAAKAYPDVQFLMVNATTTEGETKELAESYIKEKGYTFPVCYDLAGSAISAHKVTSYPTTLFIDANGALVQKKTGMLTAAALEEGIQKIK